MSIRILGHSHCLLAALIFVQQLPCSRLLLTHDHGKLFKHCDDVVLRTMHHQPWLSARCLIMQVHFSSHLATVLPPSGSGKLASATVLMGKRSAENPGARDISSHLEATASSKSVQHITCRLLIAADGANSSVRRALQSLEPGTGWELQHFPRPYGPQVWKVQCSVSAFSFQL
jgi:2-polyprenyl-6-methoxyphenol hydroxylase-like FAD-dependent oxidoreductase